MTRALLDVGLPHVLVVSGILFALGVFTVATRRSAVAVLMGVELVLNAAGLNFVAFSHHGHGGIDGQVATVFLIVLAAAEAAVALAIVLSLYRAFGTVDAEAATTLKD